VTLFYLAVGLAAGVLAGIFGIGGGIIIVPALVFFARMSPRTAIGTSLTALLLPAGALGVYAYWRAGNVDVKAALLVAFGMFLGAYGGATLAEMISEVSLRRAFAVLLVAMGARLWMTA